MKHIYRYEELENEIDVMENGSIDISLSDSAFTGLFHIVNPKESKKIFEALKSVFEPTP